jgi:hypothetical protein
MELTDEMKDWNKRIVREINIVKIEEREEKERIKT